MSTEHPCENCGATTGNPKFCGSACAAQHNNRATPKRRPGGACGECGAAILKRKRYCELCAAVVAERERKAKEGYITIRTSTGVVEVKAPPVGVREDLAFKVSDLYGRSLGEDAKCGELLDLLLGIVRARPPYLMEQDVQRYLGLLCELRAHVVEEWSRPAPTGTPFKELALTSLHRGLRSWIESWHREHHHPLMSSYALDAAEFVLAHAYGAHQHTDDKERVYWRIAPVLPKSLVDARSHCQNFQHDPTFKRTVTERIGRLLVCVKVPPGGRCVMSESREVVLEGGAEFDARILRCHLSSSFHDWTNLEAVDCAEPRFYLSRCFRIPCELPRKEGAPGYFDPRIDVPVPWMTHAYIYKGYDEPMERVPVPEWLFG